MDIYEMYLSGMSYSEVSYASGVPLSTIRRRMIKKGINRGVKDGIAKSIERGVFNVNRKGEKKPKLSEETKKKMSASKLALNKGKGWRVTSNGYIEITKGKNKGRGAHIIAMEEKISRRLYAFECVHHKDENKLNNDIENLELMTRSEHARHHAKENSKSRSRCKKGRYL